MASAKKPMRKRVVGRNHLKGRRAARNTIVDAVERLLEMQTIERPLPDGVPDDGSKLVLVTSHRRESWGTELENICDALIELVERFPETRVVYPVHLNPNVCTTVEARLGSRDRVHVQPPSADRQNALKPVARTVPSFAAW